MSRRSLEIAQWFGVLAGGLAWAVQHVVGYGVTEAACGANGLAVRSDPWQIGLAAGAGAVVLAAEASAIVVYLATRGVDYAGDPPAGRLHFFALAAIVTNLLFLTVVVLDGTGALAGIGCRQS